MGLNHGTNIVKDGLVFQVDAANPRSYPRSGATVTDLINNVEGTINSATFQNINAGVFNFDGTNDYININPGASSTIDLTSFTISAWVKWTNSASSYGTAIRLSTSGDDIWMYVGRSTGFNFGVRFYLGSTLLDDTDFLPTDEWKHIVVRFQNSGNSLKVYVDGQEKVSSTANKNPSLWNTTSANQIGANGNGGERMYGDISNIQIYNRALSAAEIKQNYNALKSRFGL